MPSGREVPPSGNVSRQCSHDGKRQNWRGVGSLVPRQSNHRCAAGQQRTALPVGRVLFDAHDMHNRTSAPRT